MTTVPGRGHSKPEQRIAAGHRRDGSLELGRQRT
jgi:hypothetical protein